MYSEIKTVGSVFVQLATTKQPCWIFQIALNFKEPIFPLETVFFSTHRDNTTYIVRLSLLFWHFIETIWCLHCTIYSNHHVFMTAPQHHLEIFNLSCQFIHTLHFIHIFPQFHLTSFIHLGFSWPWLANKLKFCGFKQCLVVQYVFVPMSCRKVNQKPISKQLCSTV